MKPRFVDPQSGLDELRAILTAGPSTGATHRDNFHCAIIEKAFKHGEETPIDNPLKSAPFAFQPLEAWNESTRAPMVVLGTPKLNRTPRKDKRIALTVNFAPTTEGEVKEATATGVSLSTGTVTAVANVSLEAGEWLVGGFITNTANGGFDELEAAVNTSVALGTLGDHQGITYGAGTNIPRQNTITIPPKKFALTATTTLYVVARAVHAVTITAAGRITAQRTKIDPATTGMVRGVLWGG